MYQHNITKMQPYKMTYTVREFNIELTTNPNEYGYFCDPELDTENFNKNTNKNRSPNYSFNNPKYTIYENENENIDIDDSIYNKYNKNKKNKFTYINHMIYGIVIIGSITITTYLVNKNII